MVRAKDLKPQAQQSLSTMIVNCAKKTSACNIDRMLPHLETLKHTVQTVKTMYYTGLITTESRFDCRKHIEMARQNSHK